MAILKTSSTPRSPRKSLSFPLYTGFGPEKCPVYLRVPWIGELSTTIEKDIKTAVESCYGSISIRLVFTSKQMLPVARKNVLPTIQKSFVIYENKCHCDNRYVGRTSQRLQDRIKATCSAMVKTAIDPFTPISTTRIVQTNRHKTGLWLCHWSASFR